MRGHIISRPNQLVAWLYSTGTDRNSTLTATS